MEVTDNRASQRRKMFKRVIVSINDGFSRFDVILRDLSEFGAQIEFDQNAAIPNQFELINQLDGMRVHCEVRRRQGKRIGVEFVSEIEYFTPTRTQQIHMSDKEDHQFASQVAERDTVAQSRRSDQYCAPGPAPGKQRKLFGN